jgi:hypothetical protein
VHQVAQKDKTYNLSCSEKSLVRDIFFPSKLYRVTSGKLLCAFKFNAMKNAQMINLVMGW